MNRIAMLPLNSPTPPFAAASAAYPYDSAARRRSPPGAFGKRPRAARRNRAAARRLSTRIVRIAWSATRKAPVDRRLRAMQDSRPHLFVVRGRLGIESDARRACGAREGLGVAWRGRERVPARFVDRRREGRARRSHEPVVFRTGGERERVRKRGVVPLAEPERPDVFEDAALGQAAISGNACFRI